MRQRTTELTAPEAQQIPKTLTAHGDERTDNYYWLNDREDSTVIAYLNAENAYRENVMADLKDFQEELYDEMRGRIKETDENVPYKDNGYYYLTRYEEGKEYPIYERKKGSLDAGAELMLDVNQMAEGKEYYQVSGMSVSPNNEILAYGVDEVSRRIYDISFKSLVSGEMLDDKIEGTTGGVAWANDNKTVFYTKRDPQTLRAHQVWRHTLGTPQSQDKMVYDEADDTFYTFAYRSKSGEYILIGSQQTLSSEYRYLSADEPMGTFEVIAPRERDHEYSVSHYGDHFYIVTNRGGAKNFKLVKAPVGSPNPRNWEEVIAHRGDVLLEGIELFKDYLVVEERKAGIGRMRIMPWSGAGEHYIDFDEDAYMIYSSTNRDFDTEVLRFGYSSLTTPNSIYDYNMSSRERELLKQQEVVGGYNPADYQSERIMVEARDGAKVPVSIVYKKGYKKDGNSPLLLYAYGSYGNSLDPYFSSVRLSLLDRGFAYAIAHIRGGQEMGRAWYEDGKLLKKMNTFNDFVDVAQYLNDSKYTSADNLYAMGGSAGGLLMGAVVNMRPDLFNGVIAAVPFVDVVTTMLDETIPLTTFEYDEWGNPNDKAYYDYMKSYSPYDNVKKQDYPAMMVTTGLHDSQVQYWEPAKWVAKLRDYKTDSNPLLLYTNMTTGHGGSSGRFERLKETAMEYAFLIELAGTRTKG